MLVIFNVLTVFIALVLGSFFWMLFDANFEGKKTKKIILGIIIWLGSSIIMWFCLFRG